MHNDFTAIVESDLPDDDKKEIEHVLQDGLDAVMAELRGVDDVQARVKPRPDAWSILDCVEHIALTEAALLSRLNATKPSDRSHADPARESRFQQLALNRERRIDAPDLVAPAGGSQTLAEACDRLRAARRDTLRFVQEFKGDLRSWLTTHPLITRPVNCYEMLLLIALHPRRHAQQIAEIREQVLPPRSPIK